jgi:phosphotriesterase-related protein
MRVWGLPLYWRTLPTKQIADFYVEEIVNGVSGSGVRAGTIKCATSAQPTAIEEKFLEAASIAHDRTGAPIITHTTNGLGGPEQQAIFANHGVALHRCLIGHCCDNADPAHHRRVVGGGSYIGFDRLGFENPPPAISADNVVSLVKHGFRRQVMLSMDRLCGFRSRRPAGRQPTIQWS